MNTDGSGLRLVAQKASPSASPAWSPDGQKLAFQGQRRGNRWNGGINVVNADGSGLQNLTSGFGPDWSPDGQKIAFVRTVRVRPVGVGAAMPDMEILVMNADGSEQQNLTRNLAVYADPVWSPDGQEIAFMSNRYDDCVLAGAICQELWVMNADGSGQQRLTRNAATDSDQSWSPDGTKIAFHRAVGPFRCGPRGCGPAESDIFVMNADGSGERNLTRNDPSNAMDADWSPDGRRIVFRTSRHGKWEVYVMNANGSGQRRLTRTPAANESSPSWSPDGRKIAFTREAGANFELYVMNADGSGQRRLTPNSPVDRWIAYSWSP